ncbi:MAG: tRNA (N6-isopentenyl adenosine(37)-C2)-methylthiotransferase MiaB [Desulfarculus sp.]|nr:MAG: tRNA (N6-isopentenyl adenosine(37)-C2)-methylthiotransferase MiaB [Desulfarculus sp.]
MSGPAPQRSVHIATFGCQMNAYDSERISGLLASLGYTEVDQPQGADLIVLNTCSVRERAEQKVYSYVGALKRLKEAKPGLLIGVGGCVAQQEGDRLLKHIPHLDFVFGTGALERLPELVAEARKGRRRALTGAAPRELPLAPAPAPRPGLKALVTVMRGCDNFCAYCVVPYVRGREQSRPAAQLLAEAQALAARGVREITLLGQNVNSYRDPEGGLDFAGLLRRLAGVEGLWRLRFTTSHPKDLSPALIETLAGEPKVMEHLHLPAQAGSDPVLRAMGRGYTRGQYLELARRLRAAVPGVALGGDVIVGFPGESEEDFQQSLSLLQEVRYDFLYSFKYSDRPFTRAGRMAGKLAEPVKAERLRRLQARQRGIGLELHRALEGQTAEVLVEGPDKKGRGLVSGRCRAGRMVNFPGGPELVGRLVKVRIEQGRENSLLGRLEPAPGSEAS